MHPPLLVLDLDGTLVDTAPDLTGSLNAVLAHEGLPPFEKPLFARALPYDLRRFGQHAVQHRIRQRRIEALQPHIAAAHDVVGDRRPQESRRVLVS